MKSYVHNNKGYVGRIFNIFPAERRCNSIAPQPLEALHRRLTSGPRGRPFLVSFGALLLGVSGHVQLQRNEVLDGVDRLGTVGLQDFGAPDPAVRGRN